MSGRNLIGLLLILLGVFWMLDRAGILNLRDFFAPIAIIVLGVYLLWPKKWDKLLK